MANPKPKTAPPTGRIGRGHVTAKAQAEAANRGMDDETHALLYQGASIGQLAVMFTMDRRTVDLKLKGLSACGHRGGVRIYNIREAAPYLAPPVGNMEDYIRQMNPDELPPGLQARFWSALRERDKFRQENGELWDTQEVLETLSAVFQTLSMNMKLMQDSVEEQSHLNEFQRRLIVELTDGYLERTRVELIERFSAGPIAQQERDGGESLEGQDEVPSPDEQGEEEYGEPDDTEGDDFAFDTEGL